MKKKCTKKETKAKKKNTWGKLYCFKEKDKKKIIIIIIKYVKNDNFGKKNYKARLSASSILKK